MSEQVSLNSELDQKLLKACFEGWFTQVEHLVKSGANVNVVNIYNETPLHKASKKGEWPTVAFLLKKGANPNVQDSDDRNTALHLAANYSVAELLVESNADMELKNHCGDTALLTAANFGRTIIVHYLVEQGADIKVINKDGCTLLHYAAKHGDIEMVRLAIDSGLSLKDKTKNKGYTPLDFAIINDQPEVVIYIKSYLEQEKLDDQIKDQEVNHLLEF